MNAVIALLDALMVEIVKINGKAYQQTDVYVEPPFLDILWEYVDDACLRGCDDVYNEEHRVIGSRKWVCIGTSLGSFKIMDKEARRELPSERVQGVEEKEGQDGGEVKKAEPPEMEDWKENIGGMNS